MYLFSTFTGFDSSCRFSAWQKVYTNTLTRLIDFNLSCSSIFLIVVSVSRQNHNPISLELPTQNRNKNWRKNLHYKRGKYENKWGSWIQDNNPEFVWGHYSRLSFVPFDPTLQTIDFVLYNTKENN
jgi:hypothetical protein